VAFDIGLAELAEVGVHEVAQGGRGGHAQGHRGTVAKRVALAVPQLDGERQARPRAQLADHLLDA
jgi:hypothetical protein